jgi:UDP-glucuronate decarboxylase
VSGRKILITGGAGFIGFHLAQQLVEDPGDEITIIDDFSRGRLDAELEELAARAGVVVKSGDLADQATWRTLGNSYDEIYHLAAIVGVRNVRTRPDHVIRVNALSTVHFLDWFVDGGGTKVLFSSTSEVYAWTQRAYALPVPTPEGCPCCVTDFADPRSTYAGTKIFGELAVTHYCQTHDKRFVIVRYHNVYGPRMGIDHVIPELFQRARDGQNPLVVYSVDHKRAFCYVSDAVAATIAAMRERKADAETINIGNDREEIRIGDLAQRLVRVAGLQVDLAPQPAPHDPVQRRSPDLTRARDLLGYEPRVGLDEGLEKTLSWYERELSRLEETSTAMSRDR